MFTLSQTIKSVSAYPSLGLVDPSSGGDETVDVKYEVVSLDSLVGSTARVMYTIQVGSSGKSFNYFEFEYSGVGNPFTEAEDALKQKLNS